jgi:hypothetical protein
MLRAGIQTATKGIHLSTDLDGANWIQKEAEEGFYSSR